MADPYIIGLQKTTSTPYGDADFLKFQSLQYDYGSSTKSIFCLYKDQAYAGLVSCNQDASCQLVEMIEEVAESGYSAVYPKIITECVDYTGATLVTDGGFNIGLLQTFAASPENKGFESNFSKLLRLTYAQGPQMFEATMGVFVDQTAQENGDPPTQMIVVSWQPGSEAFASPSYTSLQAYDVYWSDATPVMSG